MAGVLNAMRFFLSGEVRLVLVLVFVLGLFVPSVVRAQEMPGLDQPQAFVLVATPELGDRNFERSVVLVTPAPGGEMIGVILNRPTSAPWPGGLRPEAPARYMNFGGPLVPRAVFSVAQVASSVADTMDLGEGLRLAIGLRNTRNLAQAGAPEGPIKLFNGYAGWGPGQLRAEITGGAWTVRPVSAELVFDPEPATQWERLTGLRRAVRAPALPEFGFTAILPKAPAWP
jgi:putative transcriptional regulator